MVKGLRTHSTTATRWCCVPWWKQNSTTCTSEGTSPHLRRSHRGGYYWRTEPVWTYKPALRIWGRVDRTVVNYAGPSLNLIQRNIPQSNVTWPNKSNVATVTILALMTKKYRRYTWRHVCPPTRPTDSLSHFCPKNGFCQRQKTLTHCVF